MGLFQTRIDKLNELIEKNTKESIAEVIALLKTEIQQGATFDQDLIKLEKYIR